MGLQASQKVPQASRKTWHDAKRESAFKVLPTLLPQSIFKNGGQVFRPTTRILEVIHLTYNLSEVRGNVFGTRPTNAAPAGLQPSISQGSQPTHMRESEVQEMDPDSPTL
ncbi:hypothetical protein G5714_021293 [Onychostoma macrolepis]|uniref:Uncharacterized protein n=1 Tax=Onychostoma macrolepis TaxID=369639 RepID=A0A7J6BSK7_9TELE|nr:hypothetical protein G5714_021293 [Onychostoma macrolepis]